MNNKILVIGLTSLLAVVGVMGITHADFTNFSSIDRESHMSVMDKLINGETLSSQDQVVLEEIKTIRSETETFRAERYSQREELAPIFDKYIAGETLTTEEQEKLDAFRAQGYGRMGQSFGGRGFGRGGMMGAGF